MFVILTGMFCPLGLKLKGWGGYVGMKYKRKYNIDCHLINYSFVVKTGLLGLKLGMKTGQGLQGIEHRRNCIDFHLINYTSIVFEMGYVAAEEGIQAKIQKGVRGELVPYLFVTLCGTLCGTSDNIYKSRYTQM